MKIRFQREIKVLEARQRLEALVVPKRQALTRHQGLLARPQEIRQAGMAGAITDQTIRQILTQAQPFNQVMKALQFVTLQREAWVNTIDYPAYQTDADDRTYIAQLLADPAYSRTVIGQPFQRFYDAELIVPMAMNVHSAQGDSLRILSTDISVSYFSNVYQRVAKDSDAMVSLFTVDGVIIVRFPLDSSQIGQRLPDSQLATRQFPSGKVGIIFSDNGASLGLHIVYNLVTTALGGTISLESALQQGTQFRLQIPQVAPIMHKAAG